jgi:hypothetical protein
LSGGELTACNGMSVCSRRSRRHHRANGARSDTL